MASRPVWRKFGHSAADAPAHGNRDGTLANAPDRVYVRAFAAALDGVHSLAEQPGDELRIDHLRLEVLAQALEHVGGDVEQHVGIGDEELRLVVGSDERSSGPGG